MKFNRIYAVGGKDGKADSTDYVVAYEAANGKLIEVEEFLNTSERMYRVDGFSYFTLKDAKLACIG